MPVQFHPPGQGGRFFPAGAMRFFLAKGPLGTGSAKGARVWAHAPGWAYGPDTSESGSSSGSGGVQWGIGMGGQLKRVVKAGFGHIPGGFGISKGKPGTLVRPLGGQ